MGRLIQLPLFTSSNNDVAAYNDLFERNKKEFLCNFFILVAIINFIHTIHILVTSKAGEIDNLASFIGDQEEVM